MRRVLAHGKWGWKEQQTRCEITLRQRFMVHSRLINDTALMRRLMAPKDPGWRQHAPAGQYPARLQAIS
jgi:hypothetical protein